MAGSLRKQAFAGFRAKAGRVDYHSDSWAFCINLSYMHRFTFHEIRFEMCYSSVLIIIRVIVASTVQRRLVYSLLLF